MKLPDVIRVETHPNGFTTMRNDHINNAVEGAYYVGLNKGMNRGIIIGGLSIFLGLVLSDLFF